MLLRTRRFDQEEPGGNSSLDLPPRSWLPLTDLDGGACQGMSCMTTKELSGICFEIRQWSPHLQYDAACADGRSGAWRKACRHLSQTYPTSELQVRLGSPWANFFLTLETSLTSSSILGMVGV